MSIFLNSNTLLLSYKFGILPKSSIKRAMRVLGIDPGSVTTGYGLIERDGRCLIHIDSGKIVSKKGASLEKRLKEIYETLKKVIKYYSPAVVAIEKIFVSRNSQSALKLGHARGVALLSAVSEDLEVFQYTPMEIKKAITGYGRAEKRQVQFMVKELLDMSFLPDLDASDALAVAICHIHHQTQDTRLKTQD